MKIPPDRVFPNSRDGKARLLAVLLVGIVAVLGVARFVVPAMYEGPTTVRSEFTAGTVMPGAPVRPGLHFESRTSPNNGEKTTWVYLRLGSKVWLYERVTAPPP